MDSLEPTSTPIHPCVKCGACCATYRVLFDPTETQPDSLNVPKELTEKVAPDSLAILGTNTAKPRCVALSGNIGKSVGCSIYLRRPSCCRDFKPSYEDGIRNPRCDEARRGKGLKPLRPKDYL
ncbi:MAG: YkgJ family cysteine cluster protein [Bdellovibrionales bacterium]|nr:YkgJ family cysteine cluster protein [Bdellovibrionales bacterium]